MGRVVNADYTENILTHDGQFILWNIALDRQKDAKEAQQTKRAAAGL